MIYVIRPEGSANVKIGMTKTPQGMRRRLESLQVSCPDKLVVEATMKGGRLKESCIHHFAISRHVRGEWFRLSKEEVKRMIAKYAKWDPEKNGVHKMPAISASVKALRVSRH